MHRSARSGCSTPAPTRSVDALPANGVAVDRPGDRGGVERERRTAAAASAVVLNITMVDTGAAGFATVWPTGSPQPTVSSLNADFACQNVANLVTVPVGADGFISLYSSASADFIVDVQGVYAHATSSTAGRFVPLEQRERSTPRPRWHARRQRIARRST